MRVVVAAFAAVAMGAGAGPVETYYTSRELCPRDLSPAAPRLTEVTANARAARLLPAAYCGPTYFVTSCDFESEFVYESWRVYVHQVREHGGRRDRSGLAHTYLILDPVGNCIAHIPGTDFGAPN